MSLKKKGIIILIISLIFISACALGGSPKTGENLPLEPAAETVDLTPQPTNTRFVFSTITPTFTSVPTSTVRVCNANTVMEKLNSFVPYPEYDMYYFTEKSIDQLIVWFVDPEIKTDVSPEEYTTQVTLAQNHAMILAEQFDFVDECMDDLFTKAVFLVVDTNYNGWFSGKIHTSLLPNDIQTSPEELALLTSRFEVLYSRNTLLDKDTRAPSNSCTWKQAHQNIRAHFTEGQENSGFYYAADHLGRTVMAQWQGEPADMEEEYLTPLGNIANEIKCLYPEPDQILYQIVDEDGKIIGGGFWILWDPKHPDLKDNQLTVGG